MREKDPTLTLTARKRAIGEVNRRFNGIKKAIRESLLTNKIFANAEAAPKERFQYLNDEQRYNEFKEWLNEQIEADILGSKGSRDVQDHWLNTYIENGYKRGVATSQKQIKKQARKKARRGKPAVDFDEFPDIFANPAHFEKSRFLFTRTYDQLEGVTDVMSSQIGSILSQGVIQGKGINEIARELTDRVDKIGKVRARLIARTEIINAHNVGAITESERLESVLGEDVKMRWITAEDGREREEHAERDKKIYTREEAAELVGEPNCRCSVTAWLADFD